MSGEERIESFVEWCKEVGIVLHPNVINLIKGVLIIAPV